MTHYDRNFLFQTGAKDRLEIGHHDPASGGSLTLDPRNLIPAARRRAGQRTLGGSTVWSERVSAPLLQLVARKRPQKGAERLFQSDKAAYA